MRRERGESVVRLRLAIGECERVRTKAISHDSKGREGLRVTMIYIYIYIWALRIFRELSSSSAWAVLCLYLFFTQSLKVLNFPLWSIVVLGFSERFIFCLAAPSFLSSPGTEYVFFLFSFLINKFDSYNEVNLNGCATKLLTNGISFWVLLSCFFLFSFFLFFPFHSQIYDCRSIYFDYYYVNWSIKV